MAADICTEIFITGEARLASAAVHVGPCKDAWQSWHRFIQKLMGLGGEPHSNPHKCIAIQRTSHKTLPACKSAGPTSSPVGRRQVACHLSGACECAGPLAWLGNQTLDQELGCPVDKCGCFYRPRESAPHLVQRSGQAQPKAKCKTQLKPIRMDKGRPWCLCDLHSDDWMAFRERYSWRTSKLALLMGQTDSAFPSRAGPSSWARLQTHTYLVQSRAENKGSLGPEIVSRQNSSIMQQQAGAGYRRLLQAVLQAHLQARPPHGPSRECCAPVTLLMLTAHADSTSPSCVPPSSPSLWARSTVHSHVVRPLTKLCGIRWNGSCDESDGMRENQRKGQACEFRTNRQEELPNSFTHVLSGVPRSFAR